MKENETMIGLECHVQLATKSKLFCNCPTDATEPNTATCPVCLGHPGSKPVLNKKALDFAIKLCLALGCKILPSIFFSRKTYFYPDMSKNYQITQYEIPIGVNGSITLDSGKKVNITRVHLEEDPARLVHEAGIYISEYTLVDYNRSGIPLCEIVTAPELSSPEEAREFLKKLITLLNYLKIFDIDKCIIRTDCNTSIKGYERVEIKNINSFKDVEKALGYEIERQKELIKNKLKVERETRAWDEATGTTITLRKKETEEDYGYLYDPDLTKIELSKEWVEKIKKELPEFAHEKVERFVRQYKIDKEDAKIIAADPLIVELFEKVANKIAPELAAHWIRRELLRVLNYNKKEIYETKITAQHLIELLFLIENKTITERTGQKIIEKLVEGPFDVKAYIENEGLVAVSNINELTKYCKDAMGENKKAVQDYKSGNEKALMFVVGAVMKKTKGKATPKEVNQILRKLIK